MTAGIRVTVVEGPSVLLRFDEVTAGDVADVNRVLGRAAAFAGVVRDPATHDLDVAAALLWIGFRRGQPRLTFQQVADTLPFDAAVGIILLADVDDDDGADLLGGDQAA